MDELSESISLSVLNNMTIDKIKAAYLANVLAGLILIRTNDKISKRILNDSQHKNLKRFSNNMSPVNFWGLVVHNSNHADISKHLSPEAVKSLKITTGRIQDKYVKNLHTYISDNSIADWTGVNECLRVLTLRLPLRTQRVNMIREALVDWNTMDANDKQQAIAKAFFFLMESDSNSALLGRLRFMSNSQLLNANDEDTSIIKILFKIKEDEGGEAAPATVSAAVTDGEGTKAGDIATKEFRLFKGKIIKRKIRKFVRKSKLANK